MKYKNKDCQRNFLRFRHSFHHNSKKRCCNIKYKNYMDKPEMRSHACIICSEAPNKRKPFIRIKGCDSIDIKTVKTIETVKTVKSDDRRAAVTFFVQKTFHFGCRVPAGIFRQVFFWALKRIFVTEFMKFMNKIQNCRIGIIFPVISPEDPGVFKEASRP